MTDSNRNAKTEPVPAIVSSRIFDFPRELVFGAWSDPQQLAQWWGPLGFTNTIFEFNFSAGGTWRFAMHATDGTDYQNTNVFEEIVSPERIVFLHIQPIHGFRATATFDEVDGKTRLIYKMLFESRAEYDRICSIIQDSNEQNFDRLENFLSKKNSQNDEKTSSI